MSKSSSTNHLPAPVGRTLAFLSVAAVLGMGLVRWLDSSGTDALTGYVQAHVTSVRAFHDGVLLEWIAQPGDRLTPGDAVATLTDPQLDETLRTQRQRVDKLTHQLEQTRSQVKLDVAWRMKELDSEILKSRLAAAGFLRAQFDTQLKEQALLDVLGDGHQTASLGSGPLQPLSFRDSSPDEGRIRMLLEHQAAENAAEVSATQVQLCQQQIQELERLKHELPESIRQASGIPAAEQRLQDARDKLTRLEQEPRELTLAAPGFGTVGVYRKRRGDRVVRGEPVVELVDEERRFLTVHVPPHKLAEFQQDDVVTVVFPDGQRCHGTVRPIPPQEIGASPDHGPVSLTISPSGRLWPPVPIGTAAEVHVDADKH